MQDDVISSDATHEETLYDVIGDISISADISSDESLDEKINEEDKVCCKPVSCLVNNAKVVCVWSVGPCLAPCSFQCFPEAI